MSLMVWVWLRVLLCILLHARKGKLIRSVIDVVDTVSMDWSESEEVPSGLVADSVKT